MAEQTFSFSVDNDGRFRKALQAAGAALADLRVPLGLIGMDWYRSERAIFQLEGPGQYPDFKRPGDRLTRAVDKGPVRRGFIEDEGLLDEDMTPYMKRKLKKWGHTYPLLVASGALALSVSSPSAFGAVCIVSPQQLVIGTSIPYGVYPQSDRPRAVQPLRKFIFIGPEAIRFATSEQMGRLNRWKAILDAYLEQKLTFGKYQSYRAAAGAT